MPFLQKVRKEYRPVVGVLPQHPVDFSELKFINKGIDSAFHCNGWCNGMPWLVFHRCIINTSY